MEDGVVFYQSCLRERAAAERLSKKVNNFEKNKLTR